ncbi:uncharacterized protein BDR25DRAFT_285677 [Lindgomyces ingoldianus]|uniref:Uncharacterized protein n=1 Tax=Lindgomyces ingoldianus TaxID=673940 RepID=A0ACB6QYR1_9PLEO|nr:uncharacterized protein BDR25DRAFT_285677 [Lindgomyces ingoldianus]KAF2471232.1 hypothetical protein BDR25DRAFT_285677 [Lindgomyces ingoldianus]
MSLFAITRRYSGPDAGKWLRHLHRTMPPEALPPEIWMMIILRLDDHCFAWFILRRVSSFFRQVTENVFAQRIIRDFAIRFAGDYARTIIVHSLLNEEQKRECGAKSHLNLLFGTQTPTFFFEATRFTPPDTKERAVLQLQEQPSAYESSFFMVDIKEGPTHRKYSLPFYLRRKCCKCTPPIESTLDLEYCNCLSDIFFAQTREDRTRLATSSHFVRFSKELRSSKLPAIELDVENRELSFDWRSLCQRFYYDELQTRRTMRPWLRELSPKQRAYLLDIGQKYLNGPSSHAVYVKVMEGRNVVNGPELQEACQRDGWIFWDVEGEPENLTS